MANAIRSAKSGGDWTDNELIAYNITVASSWPHDFFYDPNASLDDIDPAILTSPAGATDLNISDIAAEYLGYLDLAAKASQESFLDDFAAETLKLLGYNERGTTVSTRYTIPLTICGEANRTAQTDVCLIHHPTFILLALVKALGNRTDAEAQVIAVAIAAFQFNNRKRKEHGLDPLDAMTIPAITMTGTRPSFFLVPVTLGLSNAVITGQYPAIQTEVLQCATALTHEQRANTGMEDIEYRKLALKHFLAFKTLAKSHWAHILEDV
ncbi:hypothetical protein HYPSUDRAFT_173274 [Hypholoma sublateritium FD-334 SS-4]|uniref:Uncharacterized protein n=1 Tax=Hypholoma sublateritium (strain FD-334 SS-4) TaxID=945553 RepID=A0A0D2N5V8_HYPSF|nr:hypothetical protein HYPSUDRAFT_173274 [Hypholoma sublateritium FD-334 SS-4]